MIFLLPLLALGIAVFAGRHSAPPSSPSPSPSPARVSAPSPFVVLDGFVRAGKTPPPFVVQCAIAEAEIAGRMDLVTDLVRTFIEPIVREAEMAAFYAPPSALPDGAHGERTRAATPEMNQESKWTEDEQAVHAALEAMAHPELAAQAASSDEPGPPPPRVESPAVRVAGAIPMAHAHAHEIEAPIMSDYFTPARSPIANLPPEQFGRFAEGISRESVSFDGPRHVGQFRARRERLVELGIDPRALIGNHEAQIDALCVDMADAFQHARASGMLRQHCRRSIDLGAKYGGVHTITASGIMGVIQAAGLEGAADWLENPADRDRFPHTTAMFVRANGIF